MKLLVFIDGQRSNLIIWAKKVSRSFGKLFSSSSEVLNGTTKPGCPSSISFRITTLHFFPLSRHIVPCTTNSSTPVVSVKQPLFHLVLPEYPRALSCSISKCRFHSFFPFSFPVRLELYTLSISLFSLSHSLPLSLTSHGISPLFFPYSITAAPRGRRRSTEKRRSIEYRLRSIWNARNERGWSRQFCVRCDVSKEKTVNSTRKTRSGGEGVRGKVTEGISN